MKLVSEWPFSMAGSVLQKGGACKSPFEGGVGIRLGTFWEKVSQTNRPAGKTLPASHTSFPDPDHFWYLHLRIVGLGQGQGFIKSSETHVISLQIFIRHKIHITNILHFV